MSNEWIKEFSGAITVTDATGKIIEMNDKALQTFAKYGGANLIGQNLLDVHPEPSKTKVAELLQNKTVNSYTIEKNGHKKLIHQAPWYQDNEYAGYVELSIELPLEMANFVRKP